MPTGYTAAIKDGITFQQFAMQCARAMGACVMMRDEPSNAPIPERFEPSGYHAKKKAEAEQRLAELRLMTDADAAGEAKAQHAAALGRHQQRVTERADLRAKYEAMLAEAQAWEPPTPNHAGMKEFMVSQIAQSIDFDCCGKYDTAPIEQSAADWLAAQLAESARNVEYHAAQHAEEVERTESRNTWIAALRSSLNTSTKD